MRLIGLQKAHFCTVLGHPISKPVSSDLSDSDIIGRFRRICRNLFHYYSGSSKKKTLYRIKYILRLSCARTLARKCTFLKRLGLELLEEFLTSEEQVLSLTFLTSFLQFVGSIQKWDFGIWIFFVPMRVKFCAFLLSPDYLLLIQVHLLVFLYKER